MEIWKKMWVGVFFSEHTVYKYSSGFRTGQTHNDKKVNPPIGREKLTTYVADTPYVMDEIYF